MSKWPPPPVVGEFGKPEEHLTPKQLLDFRAASALLSWSNDLDAVKGVKSKIQKEANHSPHFGRLNHFVNLHVRHTEVVAATISDKSGEVFRATIQILDQDEDEDRYKSDETPEEELERGHMSISRNFARDHDHVSRLKLYAADNAEARRCRRHTPLNISLEDTTPSADLEDAKLGSWLLHHTEDTAKRGKFSKTDISFAAHSANLVKLIRESHDASDTMSITQAQKKIQNYVLVTCCAKIYGRLSRGVDDRDLYDYAATTSTALAQKMVGSDLSEMMRFYGMSEVNRSFTLHERRVASKLCTFVLEHLRSTDGVLSPRREEQEEEEDDAVKSAESEDLKAFKIELENSFSSVQYDLQTQRRLQVLLSTILKNTNRSVVALTQFKRKAQIHKQEHSAEWPVGPSNGVTFKQNVDALNNAVEDAGAWLRALAELMGQLGIFVQANLACIAIKFHLSNVKKKEVNPLIEPARKTEGHNSFTSSPRFSSNLDDEDNSHQIVTGGYPHENEKDLFYPEFKFVDGKKWEQAASTWLDLLCLHTFAYIALSRNTEGGPEDRATAELFRRTELNIVRSSSEYLDQQLYVKDFLDDFTYMDAMRTKKFTPEEKQYIYGWLEDNGYGYSKKVLVESASQTSFRGTFHCETLLMCLYLVGQIRDQISDPEIEKADVTSEAFHLLLPSREITDKVIDGFDVLSVSKRCCPACHSLVKYFVQVARFKPKMLYAGSHSEWSQVALPPFIPKAAGEYVINAANEALQPRLLEMIEKMKNDASPITQKSYKSAASTTSKPLTFDSSPIPSIRAFVQPAGMEDSAHPDYAWPDKKRRRTMSSPVSTSKAREPKKTRVNESSPTPAM